jgi:YihY family inner membrane protein
MVGILASTLLLGVIAPVVLKAVEAYWQSINPLGFGLMRALFQVLAQVVVPFVVLFYGLVMFYKYAPRRKTSFREVWIAGLTVTVALRVLSKAFVVYANNFGKFNALYGTLGSVVAVLMWIYLSGSVIIFGGCMCAAYVELRTPKAEGNGESPELSI